MADGSTKEMLRKTCKHFSGTGNDRCQKSIEYETVIDRTVRGYALPCINPNLCNCDAREYPTEEEIENTHTGIVRYVHYVINDLSPCCEAPLDKSRMIKEGRYKGHGTCYCSKCGQSVYVV